MSAAQLFAGLLISCTGLEPSERESVKKRVEALGGQYSGHLTKKVTHLVVGRVISSEKYKSAKTILKIPVVLPAFMEDCWMRSRLGAVDLKHMEKLHAVPPLFGCQIAVSGLSVGERKEASEVITRLGGQYSTELTRSCTHLVCNRTAGGGPPGPKVLFAAKWAIPVVDRSWIRACDAEDRYVEAGDYSIQVTASQQVPRITTAAYEDVTLEEVLAAKDVPQYLDGCRVYLGDGLDDNRLALLKRLILVAGGTRFSDHYDGDVTHFIVHNQVLAARELEQLKKYKSQPTIVHDQWLLACFVAKARLEPDVYRIEPTLLYKAMRSGTSSSQTTTLGSSSQPKPSLWATKRSSQAAVEASETENQPPVGTPPANWVMAHKKPMPVPAFTSPPGKTLLFKGVRLYLHPKIPAPYLDRAKALGATINESPSAKSDYYVYPLVSHMEGAELPFDGQLVNEAWLLQCMSERRLLLPEDKHYFAPILSKRPIDTMDFRRLNVCPTGFEIAERDYFASLLSCLGGGFSEAFNKKNSHLLCNSGALLSGPKIDFALKIGIPCVSERWILDCALEGCVLPVEEHHLLRSGPRLKPIAEEESRSRSSGEATSQPTVKRAKVDVTAVFPTATSLSSTPKQGGQAALLPSVAVDTPLRKDFTQRVQDSVPPRESTDTPFLLNGLVFSISQRLWHRRDELHDLVTSLGGTFVWSYDASCTHYLHQGNQAVEQFKEFRLATHSGKHIISPVWLQKCREEGSVPQESDYPHHYPGNLPSADLEDGPRLPPSSLPVASGHSRRVSIAAEPVEVPDSYAATLDLALPVGGKRKTAVISYGDGSTSTSSDEGIKSHPGEHNIIPADRPSSTEGISQQVTLGLTLTDNLPVKKKPVFMLSAMGSEKTGLTKILTDQFEVELCDQVEWSPRVTHLVIRTVTKTEKFLSACASGAWVLKPEYIEACAAAGRLLPEAEYEVQPAWTDSNVDSALKEAPRAWRSHLAASGKAGAFVGWKVLLAVDNKRVPGLSRVLEAGGATVTIIATLSDHHQGQQFTHVIFSSHAMRSRIPAPILSAIRPETFKSADFIAEHLLAPPRIE